MSEISPNTEQPAAARSPLDVIYATRRCNLRLLVESDTISGLAAKLGYTNGSYISQLLNEGRSFTEVAARNIETKRGLPVGWMDVQRGA